MTQLGFAVKACKFERIASLTEPASSNKEATMRDWQSQAYVKHYCKYHIVFVPKYRRKAIYGTIRRDIGKISRELCRQQGVELIEG